MRSGGIRTQNLFLIMAIFFMLIGPIRLVPTFSQLTAGADERFKRAVAIRAALIATAICIGAAVIGRSVVSSYRLSIESLQIAGALVLLMSALNAMFPRTEAALGAPKGATALQLALRPLSTVIVPPAGVAAIFVFVLIAPRYPGTYEGIAVSIGIIMMLDFLAMFFNDRIIRIYGLNESLQMLGGILVVVQIAVAVQVLLNAGKSLGLVP